jgi:hypothetical protein
MARSGRILLLARNGIAAALASDAILLESPRPRRVGFVPLCTCPNHYFLSWGLRFDRLCFQRSVGPLPKPCGHTNPAHFRWGSGTCVRGGVVWRNERRNGVRAGWSNFPHAIKGQASSQLRSYHFLKVGSEQMMSSILRMRCSTSRHSREPDCSCKRSRTSFTSTLWWFS